MLSDTRAGYRLHWQNVMNQSNFINNNNEADQNRTDTVCPLSPDRRLDVTLPVSVEKEISKPKQSETVVEENSNAASLNRRLESVLEDIDIEERNEILSEYKDAERRQPPPVKTKSIRYLHLPEPVKAADVYLASNLDLLTREKEKEKKFANYKSNFVAAPQLYNLEDLVLSEGKYRRRREDGTIELKLPEGADPSLFGEDTFGVVDTSLTSKLKNYLPDSAMFKEASSRTFLKEFKDAFVRMKVELESTLWILDLLQRWWCFYHIAVRWGVRNSRDVFSLVYLCLGSGKLDFIDKHILTTICTVFYHHFIRSTASKKAEKDKLTGTHTEGLSDMIGSSADILDRIVDGHAMKAFTTLFVSIAALHLFPKDIGLQVKNVLGKPTSGNMMDISRDALRALSKLVKVGELLVKGVSIREAFFSGDPLVNTQLRAEEVLLHYDKNTISEALPIEGYMDIKKWMATVKDCIAVFDLALTKVNSINREFTVIKNLRMRLIEAEMGMNLIIKARGRLTPFGIVIYGPPGIGKSRLLKFIAKIFASVYEVPFDESMMYVRDMTSEYWEGYDPYKHRIVYYPEVGTLSENIAKVQGDKVLPELTTTVDSNPKPANMAFDGKGKVWVIPDMVMMDTNNPSLNLDHTVSNKAAFQRRFWWLCPIVKPQYLKENSCMIDTSKCNDGTDPMDRWTFKLHTYTPISAKLSNQVDVLLGKPEDDIYALYRVLKEAMTKHIQVEKNTRDGHLADDISKYAMKIPKPVEMSITHQPPPITVTECDDKKECDASCHPQHFAFGREMAAAYAAREQRRKRWTPGKCLGQISRFFHGTKDRVGDVCQGTVSVGTIAASIAYHEAFSIGCSGAFSVAQWFFGEPDMFTFSPMRLALVVLLFVYFWFIRIPSLIFLLAPLVCLSPFYVMSYATKSQIKEMQVTAKNKSVVLSQNLKTVVQTGPLNLDFNLASHAPMATAIALAVAVLGFASYKFMTNKEDETLKEKHPGFTAVEDASTFREESDYNGIINKVEEDAQCGVSYSRVQNKMIAQWNNMMIIPQKPSLHKATLESLGKYALANTKKVFVKATDRETTTMVFGVKGNIALINSHALGRERTSITISEWSSGVKQFDEANEGTLHFNSQINQNHIVDLGNDLSIIQMSGEKFSDVLKHISPDDVYPAWGDAMIENDKVKSFYREEPVECQDAVLGPMVLNKHFVYSWNNHAKGKCGLPLVMQRDAGCAIVAIHAAGNYDHNLGFGSPIDRKRLEVAIAELLKKEPLMAIHSQCDDLGFIPEPPVERSPFRYLGLQGVRYYGKHPGNILLNNKSRLKLSPFMRDGRLRELFFNVYEFQPTIQFEPPVMKPFTRKSTGEYISPYNINLEKLAASKPALDRDILLEIVDETVDEIIAGLKERGVPLLHPLTMEIAINGTPQDVFIRRISASKAAGYGFEGKKDKFIPVVEENMESVIREPVEDLKKRLVEMIERYRSGETNNVTYRGLLKDEPRDSTKVRVGKTRVFFASPLDSLILNRMFLAPFFTLMVEHNQVFSTAIGTDMHREAKLIYDDLVSFARKIAEGDISGFDTAIPFDITWASFTIISRILKIMGYNEDAMQIVNGILSDDLFPFIEMCLDILCAPGARPSGSYATAEKNTILLKVMLKYIWKKDPVLRKLPFHNFVKLYLYGDDVLGAVKDDVADRFNNISIAKGFKEYLHMDYTSSSKGDQTKEFLTPEEMSFLKRKFRVQPETGELVAPLDMNSIFKTLQWYLPSQEINLDMQMLQTLDSSMRELYFHSTRQQYDLMREGLLSIYSDYFDVPADLVENKIIKFDMVTASLKDNIELQIETECDDSQQHLSKFTNRLRSELETARAEKKEVEFDLQSCPNPVPAMHPKDLIRLEAYVKNMDFKKQVDRYTELYGKLSSLENQIRLLERMRAMHERQALPSVESDDVKVAIQAKAKVRKALIELQACESTLEMICLDLQAILCDLIPEEALALITRTGRNMRMLELCETALWGLHTQLLQCVAYYENNESVSFEHFLNVALSIEMHTVNMLRACESLRTCELSADQREKIDKVKAHCKNLSTESKIIERNAVFMANLNSAVTQSDDMGTFKEGAVPQADEEKHENVVDIGGEPTNFTTIGMITRPNPIVKSTILDLKSYLSHPLDVANISLAMSTDLNYSVDPWTAVLNSPAFRAKLRNYAFLSVKTLKIKVAISGSPFHYGRIILAYIPQVALNDIAARYDSGPTGVQRTNFLKYLSQTPGCQVVDPSSNQPIELSIPYVSFAPVIRLFNQSAAALSDVTAIADAVNLGRFYMFSLNQVKSVSATPSNISILVQAWFEGVELGCGTGSIGVITTESDDERKTGPVESFASRAALLSGALKSVPFISSFATASHIAFSALKGVASLFGWSMPVVERKISLIKTEPFGPSVAQTIGLNTSHRIVLDPMQELTVSPDIFGVRDDELSLDYLSGLEGLVDQFTWSHATAPLSSAIWESVCTPTICVPYAVAGPHYYFQPTPLCFAAQPFYYWRGKMIFRFEFVKSQFHKGKIGIWYEPNVSQAALITGTMSTHKQFLQIVDIQTTSSIEFCVDWNYVRPWARVVVPVAGMCGTITSPSTWDKFANGFIFVSPLTALQSPDDSDITVNVYVKGQDMHYNFLDPTNLPNNVSTWVQSDDINFVPTTCNDINPSATDMRSLNLDYFGEEPKSFRALLKRFHSTYVNRGATDANPNKVITLTKNIIPTLLPNTTTPEASIPGLLSYLRYAFQGMRGSLRKRFRYNGLPVEGSFATHAKVTLLAPSGSTLTDAISVTSAGFAQSFEIGTVSFVPATQGALEYEIPFYSNNLYVPAGNAAPYDISDTLFDNFALRGYTISFESNGSNGAVLFGEETAIGEDFMLARFIAAPPYYK